MGLVDVTPAHPLVVPPPMICSELSGFFLSSLNAPAGVEYSMKDMLPDIQHRTSTYQLFEGS